MKEATFPSYTRYCTRNLTADRTGPQIRYPHHDLGLTVPTKINTTYAPTRQVPPSLGLERRLRKKRGFSPRQTPGYQTPRLCRDSTAYVAVKATDEVSCGLQPQGPTRHIWRKWLSLPAGALSAFLLQSITNNLASCGHKRYPRIYAW
jgi:hypothetical protein